MPRSAPGYAGRLCSQCSDGYFLFFGECRTCPETQGGTWSTIIGITVVLALITVLLVRFRSLLPVGVIKIAVVSAISGCGTCGSF